MRQPEKDPGRAIIGGEFELEHITPRSKPALSFLTRIIEGTWTASGRSSLALILAHLKARGVEHIHLPSYLCASILQPVESIGLEYSFYPVDDNFNAWPDPPDGSAVLLIHYFGWMNSARAALIDGAKRGKYWLIEDMSHALLSNWEIPDSDRNFIFFSARKLGPAPAGGWCNIHHELSETGKELILLVNKSVEMRLARARYLAEIQGPIDQQFENEYISLFREVENYLDNDPTVMPLPSLGLDIISGVDWENAKKKRRRNWTLLNEMISDNMVKPFDRIDSKTVPLGYVIQVKDRDRIRSALASKRVFCPVHWPLPFQVDKSDFQQSFQLSASCLTLPIDQRYDKKEMNRIANLVRAEL